MGLVDGEIVEEKYFKGYYKEKEPYKYMIVHDIGTKTVMVGIYPTLQEAKRVIFKRRKKRVRCPYDIFKIAGDSWKIDEL